MEVIQDEQSGLTLQTTVRGMTFRVDAALIGSFIGTNPVPFEGVSFPDSLASSSRQSFSLNQDWHIFLSASSSCKDCATQSMAYGSTE